MCEEHNALKEGKITPGDLYRENWEHVRHVENERLGFTSVYIVIVAGVLAFLGQKGLDNEFSRYLVWLIVALSLVGALISARLCADMNAHGKKLKSLAEASGLSDYFTFGAERGWTTYIKLRILFPLIYVACTLFFSIFALSLPDFSSTANNTNVTAAENRAHRVDAGAQKEVVGHESPKCQGAKQNDSANNSLKTDSR